MRKIHIESVFLLAVLMSFLLTLTSCKVSHQRSDITSSFDGEVGGVGTCGDYRIFATPDSCKQLNELPTDEIVLGQSWAAYDAKEHLGKDDNSRTSKSGHMCILKQANPKLRLRIDVVGWYEGIAKDPNVGARNNGFFVAFHRANGIKPRNSYGRNALLLRASSGNRIYCQCSFGPQGVRNCADFKN